MKLAAGLVWRDEVGDVANHEQLTWASVENGFGVDAAVTATDDHHVWALTERGQLLIPISVGNKLPVPEAAVAISEVFWETAH
jgi:hypothetical protein